jgi:serine protease AprX
MGKFNLLLTIFFVFTGFAEAQNRYAVHYKYKPQSQHSLDQPGTFLTAKSIDRRIRQQLHLDSLDLPVSAKYISAIQPYVQEIYYNSHWLNASVVVANADQASLLQALPFVEKVVLAAPGILSSGRLKTSTGVKTGLSAVGLKKDVKQQNSFAFQNELLGIDAMHELGYKGKGITIAVFDAGFPAVDQIPAFSHIFTDKRLKGTRDFVHPWNQNVFTKNQHGTNVLSLISAKAEDFMVAGAPEADIILCITEDGPTEFRIEEYNWVKAAEYADSLGVDIINSSLGYWDFDDPTMNYSFQDLDGKTALVSIGAFTAASKGILIVNSAGNYGSRGLSSITPPADAPNILAIGAVNSSLNRSGFSSQGPTSDGRTKPDVSAFGEQVTLIRSNGVIGRANGTSFSSPQVAAMAAGLWEAMPELTVIELIETIKSSSSLADKPDNQLGYGIPNFSKALLGQLLYLLPEEKGLEFKIFPNPITGSDLRITFGKQIQGYFTLFDMQGRVLQQLQIERESIQHPFEVSIPYLQVGMYLVEFHSGNETKRTKLIKK